MTQWDRRQTSKLIRSLEETDVLTQREARSLRQLVEQGKIDIALRAIRGNIAEQ